MNDSSPNCQLVFLEGSLPAEFYPVYVINTCAVCRKDVIEELVLVIHLCIFGQKSKSSTLRFIVHNVHKAIPNKVGDATTKNLCSTYAPS